MKTENKEPRFTEVCLLHIGASDYFPGYRYPVISISTFKGMNNKDIAEGIKSEINTCYEMYEEFTPEEMKLFDTYCDELLKEPNKILDIDYCDCTEDCECETNYIYISLCKPVFKYGMQFLNE